MQLLGNRILIEPIEEASTTPLIAAPDKSKTKSPIGKVVLRGSGPNIHPELVPGAKCLVDVNYGSVDRLHDGKVCRIVSSQDVLLVFHAD